MMRMDENAKIARDILANHRKDHALPSIACAGAAA